MISIESILIFFLLILFGLLLYIFFSLRSVRKNLDELLEHQLDAAELTDQLAKAVSRAGTSKWKAKTLRLGSERFAKGVLDLEDKPLGVNPDITGAKTVPIIPNFWTKHLKGKTYENTD